jgi:hypothetical protein
VNVNNTLTDETTIVNRVTSSNETLILQSNSTILAPVRLDNLNDASFNGTSDNIIRPKEVDGEKLNKEVIPIQPFQPLSVRIDNSNDTTNLSLKTDNSSQSSLPIGFDQNQDRGASRFKIFSNDNDTLSELAPRVRQ